MDIFIILTFFIVTFKNYISFHNSNFLLNFNKLELGILNNTYLELNFYPPTSSYHDLTV